MSNEIMVYIEPQNGKVRKVSLEILAAAKNLAADMGMEVTAVMAGADAAAMVDEVGQYGASKAYVVKGDQLNTYTTGAYTSAFNKLIREKDPAVVLLGNTAIGKDLAPRLAQRLGVGMLSDCTDMAKGDNGLVFTRPIYAGKAFEKVSSSDRPVVATIRPNAFTLGAPAGGSAAVEEVDADINADDLRVIVKDIAIAVSERPELTDADIIVSGGRAMKNAENYAILEALADTVGAAVGASRAAVDAGYRDAKFQVGQTGKTVSPTLYIAAGISGAIQHLAGMGSSKVIVAINTDPEANIFNVADYGIVGDLFEIVPLLTEEFKKLK